MSAAAQSAGVVNEAGQDRNCTHVEGSRICGEMTGDGVLVVRVYPAGDTPVAVLVDEALVSGSTAGWKSHGKHRKPEQASAQSR
jgi:hypothetical protein